MSSRIPALLSGLFCAVLTAWFIMLPGSVPVALHASANDVPLAIRLLGLTWLAPALLLLTQQASEARLPRNACLALFLLLANLLVPGMEQLLVGQIPAPELLLVTGIPLALLLLPLVPRPRLQRSAREQGQVKWFNTNKGFGFIVRPSGEELFVHFRSIRGEGRRQLRDGQTVSYTVVTGKRGLQAEDVSVI